MGQAPHDTDFSTQKPTRRSRIVGIDLARAIALIGMMTAHLYAIYHVDAYETFAYQLVSGRSAALFAVLAGVSVAIVTAPGRSNPASHRPALAIRAVWVILIGLVLGSAGTGIAIILVNYGLLFLLALPFIRLRAAWLAALAVAWGLLTPVLSHLLRPELPEFTYAVPGVESLSTPFQLFTELTVTGYYPVLTWGTYLFAGMAVGRLDLRRASVGAMIAGVGAALAAIGWGIWRIVASKDTAREALLQSAAGEWRLSAENWDLFEESLRRGLYGNAPADTWWWLGVWSPHGSTIADFVHTTGTALLVIGVCLVTVQVTARTAGILRAWQIVAGAGAMTLTLYSAHVLLLATPEETPLVDMLEVHIGVALLVGAVFAALRWRGPLEWLVSYSATAWTTALDDGGKRPHVQR